MLVFQPSLQVPVPGPRARQTPTHARPGHRRHDRAAVPGPVGLQTPLQILGEPKIVPGLATRIIQVADGPFKVDQVDRENAF